MSKKTLIQLDERIQEKGTILERDAKKLPEGVLCRVVYPICNIGKLNHNGRMYEKGVWDRVMGDKDIMSKIESRGLVGHAEHPDKLQSSLEKASHVVSKMHIDESSQRVLQEFDVLDTPFGRIIDTMLKAGCLVGCSTRAEGELQEKEDKEFGKYRYVVPESYRYITTDFTADASTFNSAPESVLREVVGHIEVGLDQAKIDKDFAVQMLESVKSPAAQSLLENIKKDLGEQKREFSCVQLEAPKETADKVLEFSKSISDDEIYVDPKDPSFGREEEPHVTLKFGLHTDESKDLEPVLKGEKVLTAKLGKTDIFASKEGAPYDVVYVTIESEDLKRLNKKISDSMEHTDTQPEYIPHMTVAYVKPGVGEKYKGKDTLEGTEVAFDKVQFSGKDKQKTDIALEAIVAEKYDSKLFKNDEARKRAEESGLIDTENENLTVDGLIAKMREWNESEHGVSAGVYDTTKKQIEDGGGKMPEDIKRLAEKKVSEEPAVADKEIKTVGDTPPGDVEGLKAEQDYCDFLNKAASPETKKEFPDMKFVPRTEYLQPTDIEGEQKIENESRRFFVTGLPKFVSPIILDEAGAEFDRIYKDKVLMESEGKDGAIKKVMSELEELITESKKVEEARGEGMGQGGQRQGDGGVDECVCPECKTIAKHDRGIPCTEQKCPKCSASMLPKTNESKKYTFETFDELVKYFENEFGDESEEVKKKLSSVLSESIQPSVDNQPDSVRRMVTNLRVREAIRRAERDQAVVIAEKAQGKATELEAGLKKATEGSEDTKKKIDELTKLSESAKQQIEGLKTKHADEIKALDVKIYRELQIESSGLELGKKALALLEQVESREEVDKKLVEFRDAVRDNELHSSHLDEDPNTMENANEIKDKVPNDPVRRSITAVLEGMHGKQ